jgi:hypothetical protein
MMANWYGAQWQYILQFSRKEVPMQNPTKNNVRTFVRSLYNARLLEQTEAESVALESHYLSLEADGRVAAAEAFHKVINGLREARKGAQRLEELG